MGFIYKIYSPQGGLSYYGSTSRTVDIRFSEHKENYEIWKKERFGYNKPSYITSYKVLQWGDAVIETVEEVKENTHLIEREKDWIRKNNCVNMVFKVYQHYEGYRKPRQHN